MTELEAGSAMRDLLMALYYEHRERTGHDMSIKYDALCNVCSYLKSAETNINEEV